MRLIKGIIAFLLINFFLSCNKEEKNLEGLWAIDVITIKGEDKIFDLSINTLDFEISGRCSLPKLGMKGGKEGQWRIEKSEDDRYLIIESSANILAGRYHLIYFKDPKKKRYRMSLQSDSIEMVCSKFFQNYKE